MWHTLSKLLLCFLLGSFAASSYAEDRKIWIYESELVELKQISINLENKNQKLESDLKTTLEKSKEWEQTSVDLKKSWEIFKLEMEAEVAKKDKQIKTRNIVIGILAVAVPIGFIGGAIVF